MGVSDVFLAARDVLRDRGWGRGELFHPRTGVMCLEGATAYAAGKWTTNCQGELEITSTDCDAIHALRRYCDEVWGKVTVDVNDEFLENEEAAYGLLEAAARWAKENDPFADEELRP